MMSVAARSRPWAEPSRGALPRTRTVPSRRTSHPPLPSGRMATSTTAAGRGAVTMVDCGQVVVVAWAVVGVVGAAVVVVVVVGGGVVVVFGRLRLRSPEAAGALLVALLV